MTMLSMQEAGRSTGMAKRTKSLAQAFNFGYYLADDQKLLQLCESCKGKVEITEDIANRIEVLRKAAEKEAEISPVDMRDALTRINSPEAKADAEKEAIYKEASAARFQLRRAIQGSKLEAMVNELTSPYATNAKAVVNELQHATEVTQREMEKAGLVADDVQRLYSETSVSLRTSNKSILDFFEKVKPYLEKIKSLTAAAEVISSSDLNSVLKDMESDLTPLVEAASKKTEIVKTIISAKSAEDLAKIPLGSTASYEALVAEGFLSKIKDIFSDFVLKIKSWADRLVGHVSEAQDELTLQLDSIGEALAEPAATETFHTSVAHIRSILQETLKALDTCKGTDTLQSYALGTGRPSTPYIAWHGSCIPLNFESRSIKEALQPQELRATAATVDTITSAIKKAFNMTDMEVSGDGSEERPLEITGVVAYPTLRRGQVIATDILDQYSSTYHIEYESKPNGTVAMSVVL